MVNIRVSNKHNIVITFEFNFFNRNVEDVFKELVNEIVISKLLSKLVFWQVTPLYLTSTKMTGMAWMIFRGL